MDFTLAAGISAFVLALVHFLAYKFKFTYIPRSKWLSFSGGISVSYIFVHVLPELEEWQQLAKEKELFDQMRFLEHHLYLISLLGLTFFYGLERAAKLSYESHKNVEKEERPRNLRIFWVHIVSFCIYNYLIGYLLLHRQQNNLRELIFFGIAMAFHFLVTDNGLVSHYQNIYKRKGRWMLSASVFIGYVSGALMLVQEIYVGIIFAFVAGGVIMNILKEELPEDRKSTFWAFVLGVIGYSTLLFNI